MKTNVQFSLSGLLILILIIFSSILLTNCKGKVEVFGIIDSVENCSPPYVVYFYPDAEYRTKKLEITWDFGDGTTSHDKEPVHIYNEHGVYEVTLSIKQKEAFDSKSISLYLTEDSTAVYSDWDYATLADYLWAPAYVEFQNYSLHSTRFLWEFGTGVADTSIEKNPTFVYENEGTYTTVLNAICNTDTSKFSRNMVIKPPPKKIDIFDVTLWMPSFYIGSDIDVVILFNGYEETVVGAPGVADFPITFQVDITLFHFDGNYNSDELIFKIFSSYEKSEATFVIRARDLQFDYYPTLLAFDDLEGIQLEALIGYRD
ncbi:MAG: hypothetical protein K8R54_12830 [Bacteroidales bacterium]|nr:hypothetical protein [Bacteroidales bacterium]